MTWQNIKSILISAIIGLALSSAVLWGAIRLNAQAIGKLLGFATQVDIERIDIANEAQAGMINTLRAMQANQTTKTDSTLNAISQTLMAIENSSIVIASTFILQNPSVPKEEKEVLRARLITRGSLNQRELMERVLTIPIIEPQKTGAKK